MADRVLAELEDEAAVIAAIRRLRHDGHRRLEVYMPFPSHEVEEALGVRRSRLPLAIFGFGICGAGAAYALQWLLVGYLYPLDVGGRPPHFPLPFVIITFEMGVLAASLCAFFGTLILGRLVRLTDEVQGTPGFSSVTRDRFWLEVWTQGAADAPERIRRALLDCGALRIELPEVPDMTRAFTIAVLIAGAGCNDCDLNRMIDQPHYTTYAACEACPDGTIMMLPPPGTVARTAPIDPPELATGRIGAGYVPRIPLAVDRGVLARGRDRFDIYCAACHGRLGDAASKVAENMTLRKPANLLTPPYLDYPPGRIAAAIAEGYGLMRSYAAELPVEDRWAVVAYVKVLQRSQHASLDELPAPIQQEAARWLK